MRKLHTTDAYIIAPADYVHALCQLGLPAPRAGESLSYHVEKCTLDAECSGARTEVTDASGAPGITVTVRTYAK